MALDQQEIEEGWKLSVAISNPLEKKLRENKAIETAGHVLKVSNLPYSTKKQDLVKLFQQYGILRNVRMINAKNDGTFVGTAFVEFESETSARAAHALNDYKIEEKHISVTTADFSYSKAKPTPSHKEPALLSTPTKNEDRPVTTPRLTSAPNERIKIVGTDAMEEGETGTGRERKRPKSNEEFRKMFLSNTGN